MKKQVLWTMGLAAALTSGLAITSFAGWYQSGADWYYYHDRTGEMLTNEWVKSNDKYYYMGDDGKMVTNSLIEDEYYVDANGARLINSWQMYYGEWEDESGWRFFGKNGQMYVEGVKQIDGEWYYFEDGIMRTGWQEIGDYTYYFKDSGARATGWRLLPDRDEDEWGENWYYFSGNGRMISGTQREIDDKRYIFDETGRMLYGWVNPNDFTSTGREDLSDDSSSDLVFFEESGNAAEGWHYMSAPDGSDDYWYYFYAGKAYAPGYKTTTVGEYGMVKIDSKYYCFDEYGHLVTGLIQADGKYFFFDEEDGTMKTGPVEVSNDEFDGQEFYFVKNGSIGVRGAGMTGMTDGRLYENGVLLCAEDGMKYQIFTITVDGAQRSYLVSESGKVKTSGTARDGDGVKYEVKRVGNYFDIQVVDD